jgi:putative protease
MAKSQNKIELLVPAGSLEKFKYALVYGADAVYAGVPDISMRARVNNFTEKNLLEAAQLVHSKGRKIYVTVNIYAHNYHLPKVEKHLKFLKKIKPDAIIVSDPGIITLVKKYLPKTDIHLSTQANTTNWQAAKFWYDAGIKRIILAREVTLFDIKEIHKRVPKLELEYFVHGAMCMSYSGRCILSKWMSGQSANEGACTQPCRWSYQRKFQDTNSNNQTNSKSQIKNFKQNSGKYKTMEIAEVQSGREVELEEDSHGTYFFNSRDLNLINHLLELRKAGVMAFKIEGRTKSAYYVANVTRVYRKVIDVIESGKNPKEVKKIQKWAGNELDKLANRGYTEGFLFGNEPEHNFSGNQGNGEFQFVGEVVASQGKELNVKIHNALCKKDKIEIITPEKNIPAKILGVYNKDKKEVKSAHGGHTNLYYVKIDKEGIEPLSLIRKITAQGHSE